MTINPTQQPPTCTHRALEVATIFFGSTTSALVAGFVALFCHAPALGVAGAFGATFVASFGVGMKVFEYINHRN